ncbi:sensor histidine kinase [Sedimenticola sp.]|uniref:sensor histidine kinase n=1 Tax=Sedimenticola sp. TaxID=1940285 RepID=UPI003D11A782
MRSLGAQLRLGLASGLVLLFGLMWWGGIQAIHSLTDHFVASRLQHDAEAVLAAMRLDGSGRPLVRWRRIDHIYDQPLSGHYYQINFPDGKKVSSRSLWDQQLDIPQFAPGSQGQWRMPGPAGQELLVRVAGYNKQGQIFSIAVAEDMTPLNQRLGRFEWLFVALSLGITLLLFAGQQWIVRSALGRLERVREDMARLERGEVTALTTEVPAEVAPLVGEFNHLLVLFQQRLEHSRNGLGNLSHAFKGPINLLLQQLESDEMAAYPALKAEMKWQIERIQQLMEREMKRARLAGSGISGGRFNAAQEMPALVGVLQQIYQDKQLAIDVDLPETDVLAVDREDMLELLGNLLDNACKWAAHRVRCVIDRQESLLIDVQDDGPGVSPEALAQLAERGVRIDESVDGHGLGLAIAKDMVKRYGGDMAFMISPELGGLQVRVRLPL